MTPRLLIPVVGLLALVAVGPAAAQAPLTLYIGPQTRDGFTDVDRGILDTIKDLQTQFQRAKAFTVIATPGPADLQLLVVARRTAGDSGSVVIGVIVLPIQRRVIDTVLRVGPYEKALSSEAAEGHEAWTAAAKTVVKDVQAWVAANREALALKLGR